MRIIVLHIDLQLDRLQTLPALVLVPVQDFLHCLVEGVAGDFAAHDSSCRKDQKTAGVANF